ncbi:MAG: hypothetical protein LBB45_00515 [Methanobrevibacter sp.]|jgi:hypothetical protein|nr:hypothetical protein [Candidatus Methanovirga basalitermitum]
MEDKIKQKAMILVKETKKFYLESIFLLGLGVFLMVRRFLIMGNINSFNMSSVVNPATQTLITQYIYYYIAIIFLIRIVYKYIKLHRLKKGFKNKTNDNKTLKKYMKNNDLDDVHSKFKEDQIKERKKFNIYLIRIVGLDALLIILRFKYPNTFSIADIIIPLTVAIIIYRYLFVFHLDKKLFTDIWENNKMDKFIIELKQ